MKMKIEANKDLFDKWTVLAERVSALKQPIEANSPSIEADSINDWMVQSIAVANEVKLLAIETFAWMAQHHTHQT